MVAGQPGGKEAVRSAILASAPDRSFVTGKATESASNGHNQG